MSEEIRNKQEHDHCHSHEHHHDHIHEHHHDHNQHHHNGQNEDSKELALLKYMVEHNAHHAEEIANMAKMLREAGQITVADELANQKEQSFFIL